MSRARLKNSASAVPLRTEGVDCNTFLPGLFARQYETFREGRLLIAEAGDLDQESAFH